MSCNQYRINHYAKVPGDNIVLQLNFVIMLHLFFFVHMNNACGFLNLK